VESKGDTGTKTDDISKESPVRIHCDLATL
jgi:hypothetical protein